MNKQNPPENRGARGSRAASGGRRSRRNRRSSARTREQPPAATSDANDRSRQTRDVALSIIAVVVAVWVRAAWLTPLLLAAPAAFYLTRGAAADAVARDVLVRRWSITVFVTVMAATVFAPPHTLEAVPFASDIPARIDAWLAGNAGAPLGALTMIVAGLATIVLTVISAGIAGTVALGVVLALNATFATILISHGYNILQMTIVAVPPWQWCFMVGLVAITTPLSVFSRTRLFRRDTAPAAWSDYRIHLLLGAGLLVLAFVLRFALAGPYTSLVRHWTL